MKNYVKAIALLLTFILLTNCEKDDTTHLRSQSLTETGVLKGTSYSKVSIDEVPVIANLLKQSKIDYSKSNFLSADYLSTPFGTIPLNNISMVADSLGNTSYTFAILTTLQYNNRFFNFVIKEDTNSQQSYSYVVEYEMSEEFANAYANGTMNLSQFSGTIRRYNAEAFLNNSNSTKNYASECEQDAVISELPCQEETLDDGSPNSETDGDINDPTNDGSNTNGGGSGDGSGITGGGEPETTEICIYAGMYVVGCGASSSDTPHLASTCGGNLNIATFFPVWECEGGTNDDNKSLKLGDCTNSGGINTIMPVPFEKLELALNLTEDQATCLESDCNLKNSIYNYLNKNIVELDYTQSALDNVKTTLDFLYYQGECSQEAKDFAVDFVQITNEFPNAKFERFLELNDLIKDNPFVLLEDCAQQNGLAIANYQQLYDHTLPTSCTDKLNTLGAGFQDQPLNTGNAAVANVDYYSVEITTNPDFNLDGNPDTDAEVFNA